ncbi:MAG: hypothetical protein M0Q95_10855 [Porticoccaceae bacterium]|nr:hypothetical protein [Porticoccaceae bacterium]
MIVGLVGDEADTAAVSERLAGHGFHELQNEHEIRLFGNDNLVFSNVRHEHKALFLREAGALIIHVVREGDESGDHGVAIHPGDAVVGANGSFEGLFDRVRVAIDKRFGKAA